MIWISFSICIAVTVITAILLYKKYNPQGVLLISGIVMVALAALIGTSPVGVAKETGLQVFDVFRYVEEKFISNFTRAGLMIMTIGGYVAFMNKIEATNMLVYLAIRPLKVFKRYPYIAAILAIPIGQILFITTPSAAGVGLLLAATLYPILVNLGVSKLTALSVIATATIFDQGPGSANTAAASALVDMTPVDYFLHYQLPVVIPTTVVLMVMFYFYSKYCDKRDARQGKQVFSETIDEAVCPDAPKYFAFLPLLPLVLLILFSGYVGHFDVNISTTVAMLVSFVIAVVCTALRQRNVKETFALFGSFWQGMGNVFTSVITLIVAAEIFSGGLISLGFIDSLVDGTTSAGFGGTAISVMITIIVFLAAMLMGSGNAAFFSFSPLLPGIASQFGMPAVQMVLPSQLAASMGRAASPISGVIVAICGIAGVSPMDLAKRNLPLMAVCAAFLNILHYIIQ